MTGPVAGVALLFHGFVSGAGFAVEQDVAAFALHALWQVPLLACAAALAVRIGRPHVRVAHGIWVMTLALCVCVPFVSTVLAHRVAVAAARAAAVDAESGAVTVALGDLYVVQESAWKLAFQRHVLSPAPFAFTISPRLARGITLAYALSMVALAARLLLGWRRTRLLLRTVNTQPLPLPVAQALRRQCDAIGCEAPQAALTEDLVGPALAGVLRPTLLMPIACVEEMSPAEIEAILAHELAHLRRGDPALHVMCSLLLLPVGFHPAALWTARRVRQTREMACDAEAAERLGSTTGYAYALLQVAERFGGFRGAGAGLGFFGLGLFDSDIRPRGGYRAAVRGGRLQHGRRPATAGLPLFGVAGAMEERMQTMMNSTPQETGAKRAMRGVVATGLAAVAVLAAAMVQVQPALAHPQDVAHGQGDGSDRLMAGARAQQQLQKAHRPQAEVASGAFTEAERNLDRSKMDAQAREAIEAARKQTELGIKQRAEVMEQRQEALRQQAEANRIMALNEMPPLPSPTAAPAPGEQANKPVKIESGVMAGQLITKVQPKYPQSAKDAHISGAVVLHALIDETGKVQQLQLVSSPDKALTESAMDAVRQWVYRPYLLNGNPTSVETNITVTYSFAGAELVRPSGGVSEQERPVLLTHIDPVMPYEARQRFYTDGLVMRRVSIGSTGKVDAVQAERSPDPLLSKAAMDAVKQWTFQPAARNGVPVAANVDVSVRFAIL